jgi:hypothetical protein
MAMNSSFMGRPSMGGRGSLLPSSALGGAGGGGKKKEAFSFPTLSVEEIRLCLQELGMHVEDDDILKPKPEVLRFVYENLITLCTGTSHEELYTPKVFGSASAMTEELYEDAVPIIHFQHAMSDHPSGGNGGGGPRVASLRPTCLAQTPPPPPPPPPCRSKLLTASGVAEGFTVHDLIRPDAGRVVRNLSAVINFQKFREEKRALFDGFQARTVRGRGGGGGGGGLCLHACRAPSAAQAELLEAKVAAEREVAELKDQLARER